MERSGGGSWTPCVRLYRHQGVHPRYTLSLFGYFIDVSMFDSSRTRLAEREDDGCDVPVSKLKQTNDDEVVSVIVHCMCRLLT